jgi:hypothetical protein
VITDIRVSLCVLRARHMGVLPARLFISFPPQEVRQTVRTQGQNGHWGHTTCHENRMDRQACPATPAPLAAE